MGGSNSKFKRKRRRRQKKSTPSERPKITVELNNEIELDLDPLPDTPLDVDLLRGQFFRSPLSPRTCKTTGGTYYVDKRGKRTIPIELACRTIRRVKEYPNFIFDRRLRRREIHDHSQVGPFSSDSTQSLPVTNYDHEKRLRTLCRGRMGNCAFRGQEKCRIAGGSALNLTQCPAALPNENVIGTSVESEGQTVHAGKDSQNQIHQVGEKSSPPNVETKSLDSLTEATGTSDPPCIPARESVSASDIHGKKSRKTRDKFGLSSAHIIDDLHSRSNRVPNQDSNKILKELRQAGLIGAVTIKEPQEETKNMQSLSSGEPKRRPPKLESLSKRDRRHSEKKLGRLGKNIEQAAENNKPSMSETESVMGIEDTKVKSETESVIGNEETKVKSETESVIGNGDTKVKSETESVKDNVETKVNSETESVKKNEYTEETPKNIESNELSTEEESPGVIEPKGAMSINLHGPESHRIKLKMLDIDII